MGFHCVLGGAVEGLDTQVLFDPFEEQFDLPATAVELSYRLCRQGKIVAEEDQMFTGLRVGEFDATELVGIVFGGIEAGEDDGLVTLEAGGVIDGVGIQAAIAPVGLGSDDEECGGLVEGVEAAKVQVAAVHDVEGAGLGQEQVEDVDIVQFAIGDVDKRGNIAFKVK